ncbi:MAG: 30S ribosomal protein S6 [Sedimentisphaerales bacterium]|nr:30S ribosomal protein S6 [Sedimentisphaerales bacterium]
MAAKRLYEGMFLVDSTLAAADWDGIVATVENILKRADAEIVVIRKWDERRLAYDIQHKSRGTYILAYFKADTQRISGIEKDVQLNEKIMRVLILTTEGRPQDMIDRDIAGLPKPQPAPEPEPVRQSPRPERVGMGDEEASAAEDEGAESELVAESEAGPEES